MLATRAGRVAQVAEDLPSKYKALSSNPVPPQKKKKMLEVFQISEGFRPGLFA
jgi:hypothetical protein